jgi:hypothetical protein
MASSQAHAYALCRRPCVDCGRPRRIKDTRTKCVQTVFGAFRFWGRRYRACGCHDHPDERLQAFPPGEIIPRRTTPEICYLFAELGVRMPHRAASQVLKTCGFARKPHNDRRHTVAIGRELEAQRLDAADGQAVQMKRNTVMRVVTDRDDGLRNFVHRSSSRPMESQLDWFHIGMRLELLRKALVMPVIYQEFLEDPHAFDPVQRSISRLSDVLWRGRSWRALLQFARLRGDVDRWAAEHPGRCAQSGRRAKRVIKELRYYVCGNRRSLPEFAKQRAAVHRISTAHVESVTNHSVNHRFSKKQQMRWSPEGHTISCKSAPNS